MNICPECRVVDGHRMGCSKRLVEVIAEKDARIKELEAKLSDSFAKNELRMIGTALSYIIHNRYLPNGHDAYEERALLQRVEKMFDSKALEAKE